MTTATMEQTRTGVLFAGIELDAPEPNELNYYELRDWRSAKPLGDRILVDWEHKRGDLLGGKLVRPDTHKGMHYTGIVLSVGDDVDPLIKPGQRLLFGQFTDFEKFWNEELGRLAVVQESKQDSAFAIIPLRMKIRSDQGDYNYDR